MEEPQPGQTGPQPTVPGDPLHPAGARRVKRRLMIGLIALYVASVGSGCILILRSLSEEKNKQEGDGTSAGMLLSIGPKESVGWISIHGPIYASDSSRPWEKGSGQWSRRIKAMSETKGIKAIVLDINSPGGSVGAVQEIYSQIRRIRKEKNIPFVALFQDVAASGGYYIAAACDKIVSHPGSLTGSIGVIFSVSNLEGLFAKIGYKTNPIKSGIHKDIGSPSRPMTAEERAILQSLIDDAYGQFLGAVKEGRGITDEKLKTLADGRIFSGRQAKDAGLVDELGDSTTAAELAGKLGGISGTPKIRRDSDPIKEIFQMLDSRLPGQILGALRGGPPHLLEYRWAGW